MDTSQAAQTVSTATSNLGTPRRGINRPADRDPPRGGPPRGSGADAGHGPGAGARGRAIAIRGEIGEIGSPAAGRAGAIRRVRPGTRMHFRHRSNRRMCRRCRRTTPSATAFDVAGGLWALRVVEEHKLPFHLAGTGQMCTLCCHPPLSRPHGHPPDPGPRRGHHPGGACPPGATLSPGTKRTPPLLPRRSRRLPPSSHGGARTSHSPATAELAPPTLRPRQAAPTRPPTPAGRARPPPRWPA